MSHTESTAQDASSGSDLLTSEDRGAGDPDADPDPSFDPAGEPDIEGPDAPDVRDADAAIPGVVGDPCNHSAQCGGVPGEGRFCMTTLLGYCSYPGGYCSASCTSSAECGAGAECIDLVDLGWFCMKRCSTSAQCRTSESYQCQSVPDNPGSYCMAPCCCMAED